MKKKLKSKKNSGISDRIDLWKLCANVFHILNLCNLCLNDPGINEKIWIKKIKEVLRIY